MWQNIRCSILFHLLVPGGKWHTWTAIPSPAARSCKATFQSRHRLPLLPPPSAVIRSRSASRYRLAPHLAPPAADRLGREPRRVVVNAHADPALVASYFVDAVGDRLAQLLVHEVVDADLFGLAAGALLPSAVLEISDQLLLLGVNRDHRLAAPLERLDRGVDVLELGIPVWVAAASLVLRLPWRL